MGIDAATTLDDAQAQYLANADYEETNDVAKAKSFVSACTALMLLRPQSVGYGSETISLAEFKSQKAEARRFIAAKRGPTTRHYQMKPGYRS